ncbi:unnamed protein product [Amoebophrya sp. A25]|nr:unnamed protein product [Amoebophrya sp. A25]|eukprot:GSA25T00021642001.1
MPRVGKDRNPLLQKDEVGRAKKSCYDLPEQRHAFGNVMGCDLEGAGEVLRSWVQHQRSVPKVSNKVDYVKHNKTKIVANAPPSKAQRSPSEGLRTGMASASASSKAPVREARPGFGKPTRCSTPIGKVIGNLYAVEYEKLREEQEEKNNGTKPQRAIYHTKASEGHRAGAQKRIHVEEKVAPFVMKKFANVKPSFELPGKRNGHAGTQMIQQVDASPARGGEEE